MAPGWSWIFEEESIRNISIPVELVVGESDEVIVPEKTAGWFAHHIPDSSLTILHGDAGHYVFLGQMTPAGQRDTDDQLAYLYTDAPTVDRPLIHDRIGAQAVAFFHHNL